MAPLNEHSSLEQSPPQLGANNPAIPAEDPCTRQPRLPTETWIHTQKTPPKNNQPTKNPPKKTRGKVACRIEAKQSYLACLLTALQSRHRWKNQTLLSPFHTWGTQRKMFIAIMHSALYIMRSHECLRLPLLGAQSSKSEKNKLCGFSSKGYLNLRFFLIFQSIYMFILFPGL